MQLSQEVRGDLPMNHIVWDAETGSLDTLAASVLLFIKREQTPPPKMDRSPASSPMMKRKYYASDESSDLASDDVPNSPIAGDVSKRMKRSPSEDDFACDEWVHSNESRKIARFSKSHGQEFDSDFEYEHAGEEEEEDYAFEEDDDEWSDGRLLNPASPTSPSSMSRTPRKKAPSGTACEKHKRWKKRCPEDCPMRKSKSKRSSKAPTTLVRSRSRQDLNSPRDDHLSLLQWSIDQFSQESDSAIESHNSDSSTGQMDSEPEMIMNHPKMRNKTHLIRSQSTDELDLESPKIKSPKKLAAPKRNRGTRKYLPQACDRHKLLHAKCPANCPDRMKRDAELNQQFEY